MGDWIGRTLSKVRIERLLGRGGMAEVYLGLHTTLNRNVAVKILHGHLSGDLDLLQRFRAEAQAVAGFRHPNIVHILDFDVADGSPYIVMELLEGMSLAEYLQGLHSLGTILPLEAVARLTLSIASALDYAHAQGIVHRDVKPANVMLRSGSTPVRSGLPLQPDVEAILTDFGVARIAGGIAQTASGTILGTPAYMSPEQIRGEHVDARSDVYSLGIIVYELLAGRLPFDGETETPASILFKHLNDPPPPLANTSGPVREVVERALAKDRAARYQQAGDFARDLAHAVGLTIPAQTTPAHVTRVAGRPGLSMPRINWRRSTIWLGLGAGVALLAAVAILAWPLALGLISSTANSPSPSAPAGASLTPTLPTLPAAAIPTPTPAIPVGVANFHDDTLHIDLTAFPAAGQGQSHHAWLETAGSPPVLIGPVQASSGVASLDYTDPAGANLLVSHDGMVISIEPEPDPDPALRGTIGFAGTADLEALALIRLLHDVVPDSPTSTAVLEGLAAQLHHFTSHLSLALEAISSRDLVAAKLHSEHVINIIEGRSGEMFGDWNGDELAQNPGDDFGLLPYLRLLAILTRPALGAADAEQDPESPEAILASRLEQLIAMTEETRGLASRIATADLISEVERLTDQVTALPVETEALEVLRMAEGLDLTLRVPITALEP